MKFTKMHGIGNDYVYVNCFEEKVDFNHIEDLIIKYSDRHFGIGSDGFIFICPSDVADAKMVMYNADGSIGKMCGNGIRCVGKYVYEHGICKRNPLKIETLSGVKELNLTIDNQDKVTYVLVNMGKPTLAKETIPVISDDEEVVNKPVVINQKEYKITCVSMGNPHCVVYVDDVNKIDIAKIGPDFENNSMFPERVNTEFIEVINPKELKMRVWERGSGETLACGTGACASVVASVKNGLVKKDEEIIVHLKGGDLFITYKSNNEVIMKGSATEVFTGELL